MCGKVKLYLRQICTDANYMPIPGYNSNCRMNDDNNCAIGLVCEISKCLHTEGSICNAEAPLPEDEICATELSCELILGQTSKVCQKVDAGNYGDSCIQGVQNTCALNLTC